MACSSEELVKWSNLAKDEIGESKVNLCEEVRKVREIVANDYPSLRLPPDAAHFVGRCLRCRKFDVERAAAQVHLFFRILADLYQLHKELYFLPSVHLRYYLDSWAMWALKSRDSEGRAVIIADFEKMPAKGFDIDKLIVSFVTVMDELCRRSVETQQIGITVLVSLRGYEIRHARQLSIARIRLITRLLQGSIPIRYKSFHLIRGNPVFTISFALLKPFLSEKMKHRFHFYGNDLTEFHKHISPEILPESFGGNIPDSECRNDEFVADLYKKDEYYRELFRYGYIKKKENSS